ncbi:MAG: hypothetical protein KDI88_14220 [Gammaproteobacteria bacterium]|nr:hypothetical protein [Gammaproteobacteria bacterium]
MLASCLVLLCGMVATSVAAGEDVTWHPVYDAKAGMLAARVPLPAGWELTPQEWIGPGETRVKEVMGGYFDGVYATAGQIIEQQLIPQLQQSGNRVVGIEDYPAIAERDQRLNAQYWSVAPMQKTSSASGVIYEDDAGLKGVVVVRATVFASEFSTATSYYMNIMEGRAGHFERNREALLFALANTQANPEQIAAFNRREQEKAAASTRSFNARQQQKQQQFDGWMATQRQASDSALDSSMDSWRRRQGMIDSGHQRQVDAIGGVTQVYQPSTGETWQVDDGYSRYYMNNSGEYIPTDDAFYDPNLDPALNQQPWMEVVPNAYGR